MPFLHIFLAYIVFLLYLCTRKGFYVTLLREQAELWADRMARQRKGEKMLSVYEEVR